MKVEVTNHAMERYRERFDPGGCYHVIRFLVKTGREVSGELFQVWPGQTVIVHGSVAFIVERKTPECVLVITVVDRKGRG